MNWVRSDGVDAARRFPDRIDALDAASPVGQNQGARNVCKNWMS
jgi:hypothetical protein